MEKKKAKRKINSSTFLLMITIVLFAVMYIAGMIIFEDKGFAKPQMFMNLFISNAGLIVIGCGMTLVMITGGIDISVGSVTALVCMSAAYAMENKGMSAISSRCDLITDRYSLWCRSGLLSNISGDPAIHCNVGWYVLRARFNSRYQYRHDRH